MPKYLKVLLIISGTIVCVWILGRITGAIQYYKAPTPANEPTIRTISRFFGSNLVSPVKKDFICFNGETPGFGRQLRIFRLCGVGADIVEIRNGDLYVNNELFDSGIRLYHEYSCTYDELEKIRNLISIDEGLVVQRSKGIFLLPLEDDWVIKNKIKATRWILPGSYEDQDIFKAFSKHWNQDNFGPIKVPKDHFFVLGDNRHNAYDSRYEGFIDKKDLVSTVLWKK